MGIESLSDADLFALKAGRLDKVSDEGLMALKQQSTSQIQQPTKEKPKNVLERNFPEQVKTIGQSQELGAGKGYGDLLSEAAYNAGGRVTDVLSSLPAPIAAGAGMATNMAVQSIPALVGGAIGKTFQPAANAIANRLMTSAVKPSITSMEGTVYGKTAVDAAKNPTLAALTPTETTVIKGSPAQQAIDTMLKEGITVSPGGMSKLNTKIMDLNKQITDIISTSGKTVDKADVASRIQDVIGRIERTNPTPQDAIKDVERVYTQFMQNGIVPRNVPVPQAQQLKQGIYQVLRDKYGTISSDTNEAMKGLARGFKETISKAHPEVNALNAQESKLLNALDVSERQVLMNAKSNPLGLSLLTSNPLKWAAFMADKSPMFKSLLARMLYSGELPATAGMAVGGGISAASGRNNQQGALATLAAQQNNNQ